MFQIIVLALAAGCEEADCAMDYGVLKENIMIEINLFYYTGMAIWVVVCAALIVGILFVTIIPFLYLWKKERKMLWHWRVVGKLATMGITINEVDGLWKSVYRPCPDDLLFKWIKDFLDEVDKLRKDKENL